MDTYHNIHYQHDVSYQTNQVEVQHAAIQMHSTCNSEDDLLAIRTLREQQWELTPATCARTHYEKKLTLSTPQLSYKPSILWLKIGTRA